MTNDDPFDRPRTTPQTQRPPSRREVLWEQLEREHERLGLPYPTETLTLEELDDEIARLRALPRVNYPCEE